jgi:hypothetical protein
MQWDMNIGIQCLTYAAMRKTILKWCVFLLKINNGQQLMARAHRAVRGI